jgi:hypothetical protein
LYLDTYLPEHVVGDERTYRIRQEKKYRSILKEYAINDVFAVTKLIYHMKLIDLSTPPPTIEAEENDYEEQINMQQEPSVELKPPKTKLNVHVRDELIIVIIMSHRLIARRGQPLFGLVSSISVGLVLGVAGPVRCVHTIL